MAGLILMASLASDFETAATTIGRPVDGPPPADSPEPDRPTHGDSPAEAEAPQADVVVWPVRSVFRLLGLRVAPLALLVVAMG